MNNNKQLLDEVEHDIMNYQKRGLCYLPKPKAEADNRHEVLIIHGIMRKPNSIIVLWYIFHIIHPQKQKRSVQPFCYWGEHSKGLSNRTDVELDMINAISRHLEKCHDCWMLSSEYKVLIWCIPRSLSCYHCAWGQMGFTDILNQKAKNTISETVKSTVENHCRMQVQMHAVARH